jgi:hypothetical protein
MTTKGCNDDLALCHDDQSCHDDLALCHDG